MWWKELITVSRGRSASRKDAKAQRGEKKEPRMDADSLRLIAWRALVRIDLCGFVSLPDA